MKKNIVIPVLVASVFLGFGCMTGSPDGGDSMTKDEARDLGKADWGYDVCDSMGWYGDGECDDFCPRTDSDCVEEALCGPFLGGFCDEGYVCDLRSCTTGGTGTCVPRFDGVCIEVYEPVCGCDGNTYSNDCHRLTAGVALDHEGACDQPAAECGPFADGFCDEGYVCDIQSCMIGGTGTCVPRLDGVCIEIYEPVCGCDGDTYSNDCHRLSAGVGLDHEGPCAQPEDRCGGLTGGQCLTGEVCDYRMCGEDVEGTCVPEPGGFCPAVYDPVCGCNGATYSNDCNRLSVGVALDHVGACENPDNECGGISGWQCPVGAVCDYRICGLDVMGTCVPEPGGFCPAIYEPVCACNGTTYSNDCNRLTAGVAFDYDGPCL